MTDESGRIARQGRRLRARPDGRPRTRARRARPRDRSAFRDAVVEVAERMHMFDRRPLPSKRLEAARRVKHDIRQMRRADGLPVPPDRASMLSTLAAPWRSRESILHAGTEAWRAHGAEPMPRRPAGLIVLSRRSTFGRRSRSSATALHVALRRAIPAAMAKQNRRVFTRRLRSVCAAARSIRAGVVRHVVVHLDRCRR